MDKFEYVSHTPAAANAMHVWLSILSIFVPLEIVKKSQVERHNWQVSAEDWYHDLDEDQRLDVEDFFDQGGIDMLLDEFPVLDTKSDAWLDDLEDFLKEILDEKSSKKKKKKVNKRDPTRVITPEPEPEPVVPTFDDDSDSYDEPKPRRKKKPVAKPAQENRRAAFDMLMMDSDEEEDDDFWGHAAMEEEEEEPEPEPEPEVVVIEVKKEPARKKKKKKGKKGKKKQETDDDIWALLDNEIQARSPQTPAPETPAETPDKPGQEQTPDSPSETTSSGARKKVTKVEKRRLKRQRQKEKAKLAAETPTETTSPKPKEKQLTAAQLKRIQQAEEWERQQAEIRQKEKEEQERIAREEEEARIAREKKKAEAMKPGKKKNQRKQKRKKATKAMASIGVDVEERRRRAAEKKRRDEEKRARNKQKRSQRINEDLERQKKEEEERKRREEEARLAAEAERKRREEEERRRAEEERKRLEEEARVAELERIAMLEAASDDSDKEETASSDGGWDGEDMSDGFDDDEEDDLSDSGPMHDDFNDDSEDSDVDEPVMVQLPAEAVPVPEQDVMDFDDESEPESEEPVVVAEPEPVEEEIPQGPTEEELIAEFESYGFVHNLARKLVDFGFHSAEYLMNNEDLAKDFVKTLGKKEKNSFKKQAKAMAKKIKNAFMDNLRAPIGVIMGNVNAGKTALLDNVRGTKVQLGEAGGITQQIGATNLPMQHIVDRAGGDVVNELLDKIHVPGLLIIDTPGHAAFDNLRARGSSMCDIAIVVINIFNGMEGTTTQCIQMLLDNDAPFIVALNQIDRLGNNAWESHPGVPIRQMIDMQERLITNQFEKLVNKVKLDFATKLEMNADLFWENEDLQRGKSQKNNINMVPTSAWTGDGVGDMLFLWVKMCQMKKLAKKLVLTPELNCTVLECKKVPGHGFIVDVILSDGTLRRGDTIVFCGQNGAIVTKIRSLLQPSKLQDLRVKSEYTDHPVVHASCGVRISTVDSLEDAIPGAQVFQVKDPRDQNEIEDLCDLAQEGLEALNNIVTEEYGVFVVASTLGALSALVKFLKEEVKVPIAGTSIGHVHKKQIMQASVMLEKQPKYAVILAFDVDIKPDAAEYADYVGVRIFVRDIIYQLQTDFTEYFEAVKQEERDRVADDVVFPVFMKIYEEKIFRRKNPLILGCQVMKGTLKMGTPLVAMNPDTGKEDVLLGSVTGIQENGLDILDASVGQDVAVKIDLIPNQNTTIIEYGRHFSHEMMVCSRITRRSLDVIKQHYRGDLERSDLLLLKKLKDYFQIK